MPDSELNDSGHSVTLFAGRRSAGREGAVRPRSLDRFLKDACVPYTTFRHPVAYTAQHEAEVSHVPGRLWAKVVVCFADDEPILAVVPAHYRVDFEELRALAGARTLRLAGEREFAGLYPDCEPGTMPPFGGLYLQRVFMDQTLVSEPEIAFNAGTHSDAIWMHAADLCDLAHPIVGVFGNPLGTRTASGRGAA